MKKRVGWEDGRLFTMGSPDMKSPITSVGDKGWTTVSTCSPDVSIKGSFKLKRR